MSWIKTLEQLAPMIVSVTIPGAGPVIGGLVAHAITEAEKIKGANGAAKLQSAVNITNDAIDSINAAKPGTIDKDMVNSAISNGISTTVDVVNLIHGKKSSS